MCSGEVGITGMLVGLEQENGDKLDRTTGINWTGQQVTCITGSSLHSQHTKGCHIPEEWMPELHQCEKLQQSVTCNLEALHSLFIILTCKHNLSTEYVHALTYLHTQFYVPTKNCQ
jgi:hypothetical protein